MWLLLLDHYNPQLLNRYFEHFIFDKVKSWDSQRAYEKFTKVFEKYIEKTLRFYDINLVTENEIQKAYGREGKQIDFVVLEDQSNIYIDAKGVALNDQGMVSHSCDIVTQRAYHLTNAIDQAHDVLRKVEEQGTSGLINLKPNNYILVVTYKEFFISNGKTLENFASDKLQKVLGKYKTQIPLENIYFLTVDEFDLLCDLIQKSGKSFKHFLDIAKLEDSNPDTSSFTLGMKVDSWRRDLDIHDLAKARSEEILDRIKQKID